MNAQPDLKEKRILALDIGSKRIGLALWEPGAKLARPLKALHRKLLKDDLRFLAELVTRESVEAFLVGLPISLAGHSTQSTKNSEFWVEQIKSNFSQPVYTYDESLSTKEALNLLKDRSQKKENGTQR